MDTKGVIGNRPAVFDQRIANGLMYVVFTRHKNLLPFLDFGIHSPDAIVIPTAILRRNLPLQQRTLLYASL
jgi:hypothetical protein